MSKGGQRPTTMPINELMNNNASGGKGGAQATPGAQKVYGPVDGVDYDQIADSYKEQISIASPEKIEAIRKRRQNLPPEPETPTFNPRPMVGKGGQDPSTVDPSWRPMEPTIPQQPAGTPTFNPNPMGGKGGQQEPPRFNPYPMGGKGGYGGMQGGKGGYGQVSVNPYVQGGKGGYSQPSPYSQGGKGGYSQPNSYSQPMGGKGGSAMPQPSVSSSNSGGKGGQQTGGNPYAIARPSASSGGKGGSTGGKGG